MNQEGKLLVAIGALAFLAATAKDSTTTNSSTTSAASNQAAISASFSSNTTPEVQSIATLFGPNAAQVPGIITSSQNAAQAIAALQPLLASNSSQAAAGSSPSINPLGNAMYNIQTLIDTYARKPGKISKASLEIQRKQLAAYSSKANAADPYRAQYYGKMAQLQSEWLSRVVVY